MVKKLNCSCLLLLLIFNWTASYIYVYYSSSILFSYINLKNYSFFNFYNTKFKFYIKIYLTLILISFYAQLWSTRSQIHSRALWLRLDLLWHLQLLKKLPSSKSLNLWVKPWCRRTRNQTNWRCVCNFRLTLLGFHWSCIEGDTEEETSHTVKGWHIKLTN